MGFRKFLLITSFVFLAWGSSAQKTPRFSTFSDRLFYGGALGLAIGHITQVDVMPLAGIWIFPQWSVGVSGRYSFYNQSGYVIAPGVRNSSTHIWGGSVFTQILPIPDFSEVLPVKVDGGIFFHAEYEKLFLSRRVFNPNLEVSSGKIWVDVYLIGVGYRQPLGERAAINMMLLWDVSKGDYSPYPNSPMLRLNITL